MTTLTRGHLTGEELVGCKLAAASGVHGQPVRAANADGKSARHGEVEDARSLTFTYGKLITRCDDGLFQIILNTSEISLAV